jgi:hypothetical protein
MFRCVSAALSGLLLAPACLADPVPEIRMKAAFLYNFALFTEWPDATGPLLRLCVLGQDFDAATFHEIDGQEVNGRKLHLVQLASADDARSCQILYVGESERARVQRILAQLNEAPVLTVSDDDEMAKSGIMIAMHLENRKMVFSVNAESVKRSHLNLSSRLLRLARKVD